MADSSNKPGKELLELMHQFHNTMSNAERRFRVGMVFSLFVSGKADEATTRYEALEPVEKEQYADVVLKAARLVDGFDVEDAR